VWAVALFDEEAEAPTGSRPETPPISALSAARREETEGRGIGGDDSCSGLAKRVGELGILRAGLLLPPAALYMEEVLDLDRVGPS
jgi:hypothetical protein